MAAFLLYSLLIAIKIQWQNLTKTSIKMPWMIAYLVSFIELWKMDAVVNGCFFSVYASNFIKRL